MLASILLISSDNRGGLENRSGTGQSGSGSGVLGQCDEVDNEASRVNNDDQHEEITKCTCFIDRQVSSIIFKGIACPVQHK